MSVSKSSSAFNYHRICPIKTVAIIGGGSSGLITARHLIEAGLSVTVFEQHGGVGDSWVRKRVYDPENEATRPPSEAAFVPVARGRQGSRTFLEEASEDVAYQSSRSAEKVNPISSIIVSPLFISQRQWLNYSSTGYHHHNLPRLSSQTHQSARISNLMLLILVFHPISNSTPEWS